MYYVTMHSVPEIKNSKSSKQQRPSQDTKTPKCHNTDPPALSNAKTEKTGLTWDVEVIILYTCKVSMVAVVQTAANLLYTPQTGSPADLLKLHAYNQEL